MKFEDKVQEVKQEMQRLLKRISEWEAKQGEKYESGGHTFSVSTPKQNGAVKRASLDLTRSLANLRKPNSHAI